MCFLVPLIPHCVGSTIDSVGENETQDAYTMTQELKIFTTLLDIWDRELTRLRRVLSCV